MSEIARDRDDMALQELLSSVERPLDAALLERARDVGARHFGAAQVEGGLLPEGALLGSYRLERVLGVGGQAAVYLGRHQRLPGRLAAIKVPHGETTSRMLREADAMARLDHPGILGIVDVEPDGNPPYLVLDYCVGGSLADRLGDGPLSEDETLRVLRAVLEALACAHDQAIVHRDLKPENILFDGQGNAHIADFGLGKVVAEQLSLSLSQGTRTGIAGTPTYMAPEQERPGAPVDGRTDLYAVGKLVYAMLTGQSPRTLRPIEHARKDLRHPWSELVFKLTEGFPDARPASARAVLEHLDRWETPAHSSVWKRTESQVTAFAARVAQDATLKERAQSLSEQVLSTPNHALAFIMCVVGALAVVSGVEAGLFLLAFGFFILPKKRAADSEAETKDPLHTDAASAVAPLESVRVDDEERIVAPRRNGAKVFALVVAVIGFIVTFFTAMGATITMVLSSHDHRMDEIGTVAFVVAGFFLVGSGILLRASRPSGRHGAAPLPLALPTPPTPPTPPTTQDDDPLSRA